MDPCDDDSRHYKLKTHPIDNSNDAEIGQQLIDLLLRTGEIEEKSTIQTRDNESQNPNRRKNEMITSNVKNDRYDELLAAFNVILEEILRQGNSRLPNGDLKNGINQRQNDDAMHDGELGSKYCQQSNCNRKGSDPMERCLNPFEGELLRKIKALNLQLNSFMPKLKNDRLRKRRDIKESDEFSTFSKHTEEKSGDGMKHKRKESDDWFERRAKQKPKQSDEWDIDKLRHPLFEMPKSNEFIFFRSPPPFWEEKEFKFLEDPPPPETSHEEFIHKIEKREMSFSPDKRQNETDTEIESENVLNKENDFGVDLQKFMSYLEDGLEKLENPEFTERESKDEPTESNNNIRPNGTNQTNRISMKLYIQIPMRLVKKPDGRIYLVVNRRNSHRKSQCKRPKSK